MTSLGQSIRWPLLIVSIFWLIEVVEFSFDLDFNVLGIYPMQLEGLPGILISPFLHGNFAHLASNSATFIILSTSILFFYPKIAFRVILYIYLLTGSGVWLLARGDAYHIGASGLIYGFAGFLFFSGVFRKDFRSLTISLIIALLYGSMLYGIFPNQPGVSWESHFIGAVVGAFSAYYLRRHPQEENEDRLLVYGQRNFEGYQNIESPYYRYVFKEHEVGKKED